MNLKIGLMPLYLELYDQVLDDDKSNAIKAFAELIKAEYENRCVDVLLVNACCSVAESRNAVASFENAGVAAVVTLHLAYSPSLESVDVLAGTELPLILLDTTPDYDFGFEQNSERILYNHGIHGVQDLCNMLIRRGKKFSLEVGHWKESDVVDRTVSIIKGCHAAKELKNAKVGIIGEPFKGMGDFAVPFGVLKGEIGFEVILASSEDIAKFVPMVESLEVKAEIDKDLAVFERGDCSDELLAISEAAGLGVRQWIDKENLTAFTMNFGDITGAPGLSVVPFLEASKSMARGIGYGGEGDVLTAAFCGALATAVPETTFTEMFCPDWNGEKVFMSHMGEINIEITAQTPVLEKRAYPFSAAGEPVVGSGCLKPGNAWLLNVAPGPDNTFSLVATPVEVCDTAGNEKIDGGIRGWIKPEMPIADFLKKYSLVGGTHHCVLCYGVDEKFVSAFAQVMGWALNMIC
jgi:L-arabinose isomerase